MTDISMIILYESAIVKAIGGTRQLNLETTAGRETAM